MTTTDVTDEYTTCQHRTVTETDEKHKYTTCEHRMVTATDVRDKGLDHLCTQDDDGD